MAHTAELLEYGDLSTDLGSSVLGLGTYSVDMSSGTINVDFTPNAGLALTANTVRVSMSSTESVGVGTTIIGGGGENVAELQSFHTSLIILLLLPVFILSPHILVVELMIIKQRIIL